MFQARIVTIAAAPFMLTA